MTRYALLLVGILLAGSAIAQTVQPVPQPAQPAGEEAVTMFGLDERARQELSAKNTMRSEEPISAIVNPYTYHGWGGYLPSSLGTGY